VNLLAYSTTMIEGLRWLVMNLLIPDLDLERSRAHDLAVRDI